VVLDGYYWTYLLIYAIIYYNMSERLETAISGSFKFKPEIDALIDEFAEYNVTVLEPSKGWLYIPRRHLVRAQTITPLPAEKGLGPREIEDRFLRAVERSDFLYVYNPEQYIGTSTAFEIGFALGLNVPIFLEREISLENIELNLDLYTRLKQQARVASPMEAVDYMKDLAQIQQRHHNPDSVSFI
jgi:hypothetical protein